MSLNRMVTTSLLLSLAALAGACGDDDPSQTGGNGGGEEGGGGEGGGPPATEQELEGEISSITLTSDTLWILKGVVSVPAGETLTIEPGTTIVGDKASLGTLVVQRGGKIDARGTATQPIVFTSALPAGERGEGDWGGVVILGKAPINEAGGEAEVEGFQEPQLYGGTDADDDSGTLEHVRIEFGGIEISDGNEINGLTLAGVGRGTTVDFVQVKNTLDDCFEFFGGTVNASHLVCYRNGDDGFDFDSGYTGSLQFLFLVQDPTIADDANGFEADNDKDDPEVAPVTNPKISNVTLCGQDSDQPKQQFGFLFRRGFNATITNALVAGFEAGVDFRDVPPTEVELTHSVFVRMSVEDVAYVEDQPESDDGLPNEDDDGGFDEIAWFEGGEGNTSEGPDLSFCFASTPSPGPAAMIPGGEPVGDALDPTATYVGAFKDASDDWMSGWTDFAND
ncbi:MAG: T9SS C-terminal target domain-containing protein [Polyangiaceae bacterium]|nr:T9SS C-terminal target domain-containing protein [Polyangiaceae bacterium]MBK8942052.1 T9SS C-terminal target domain-containing protein [Polyangiaceae bacterium]